MNSQQNDHESFADKQRMRLSRIQDDLMRVVYPLPSRSCLESRSAFDNASRNPPFERGQKMLRDASKAARRLPQDKQDELKAALIVFYQTLLEDALEPLSQPSPRTDVLQLFQRAETEQTEAVCAIAQDLQAPNATNDLTTAREFEQASIADKEVAEGLRNRARGFFGRTSQAEMTRGTVA